jgi:hypothetical protein
MKLLEKNYKDIIDKQIDKFNIILKDNERLNLQINDCKELLKNSLENENKHENIIKDYEKIFNDYTIEKENLKNKYDIEKDTYLNRNKFMEVEIKDQNEQILKLDTQLKNIKLDIIEKDKENNKLYNDYQKLKKELSYIEININKKDNELIEKNNDINILENKLKSDYNIKEIEELNHLIKTKDMIIDDQTKQILDLKNKISIKLDDINKYESKIDKIRIKYDKKISILNKEIIELNQVIEQLKITINENEDNLNNIKFDLEKVSNENIEFIQKINERDEIVKLIKSEFNDIKYINEDNQNKIIVKDEIIKELNNDIDELKKNLLMKNNESKDILIHFEEYKNEKQIEINKLNIKIDELNEDMLLLISEYDKQKVLFKNNLNKMNEMFGK